MTAKVFISRRLSIEPEGVLGPHSYRINSLDRPLRPRELIDELQGCRGLLSMLTDPIDEELLSHCPDLEIVAQHAVGTDNIDLAACRERSIHVTHTPGVLTDATADLTLALILGLSRRLVEGDRLVRRGGFQGWSPTLLVGRELQGRVLGIIGYGRIGRAVAQRARAFGLKVLFHTRSPVLDPPDEAVGLDELLERSDILSLHCPLTEVTRGLIDGDALARLRPGALVINTARGPIIDEAALAQALERGHLGGAGLDVYAREPEVHPALIHRDDVVLLPHLGSADQATRRQMAEMCLGDLRRVLEGELPRYSLRVPMP
ncbi:MAG: D-glycerate dehydrogenase [Myxococcales bacterium]|nr:D-glycerate dehydrogenase [Myxococcales bacterium]|tara:strand:+ start:962 stop:1915 length:954 start_codon:yes stop_codon:yes gene_type:complete